MHVASAHEWKEALAAKVSAHERKETLASAYKWMEAEIASSAITSVPTRSRCTGKWI